MGDIDNTDEVTTWGLKIYPIKPHNDDVSSDPLMTRKETIPLQFVFSTWIGRHGMS